jgi:hypothetical protein
MKLNVLGSPCSNLIAALALFVSLDLQVPCARAQGSLTPPGAPAPTFKTLQEIEPRTPITSAPFIITNSGSYYLTANLTVTNGNAITIGTNDVTLDLKGFTIRSTAVSAAGRGVFLGSGVRNVTIQNGVIVGGVTNSGSVYGGPGFGDGIAYAYSTPDPGAEIGDPPVHARVVGVTVTGCMNCGINVGDSPQYPNVVDSCLVKTVGLQGISASTVKNSSALDCGETGIQGNTVSDSRGQTTGPAAGIQATTVQNSTGESQGAGYGISATTALNCSGNNGGTGRGISATTAQNCNGFSPGGTGVYATTAMNCSGRNGGVGAAAGLQAESVAMACSGFSVNGIGLVASNACFSTGERSGGTAIQAFVATGCVAIEGTNNITFKYNMP